MILQLELRAERSLQLRMEREILKARVLTFCDLETKTESHLGTRFTGGS